jgi:hypothetical protein
VRAERRRRRGRREAFHVEPSCKMLPPTLRKIGTASGGLFCLGFLCEPEVQARRISDKKSGVTTMPFLTTRRFVEILYTCDREEAGRFFSTNLETWIERCPPATSLPNPEYSGSWCFLFNVGILPALENEFSEQNI